MAKVYMINGVRCVPETAKFNAEKVIENAKARSAEKAELTKLILENKVNDILRSI